MPSLLKRDRRPELMDDPRLDPAEHRRALAGLARVNAFTGSVKLLWPPIRELAKRYSRPLKILDIATGSGDIPLGLQAKAKRVGVALELHACDLSSVAIETAKQQVGADAIRFFTADVLNEPIHSGFDLITCSLFLHHLDDCEVKELLKKLSASTEHVLISDLVRSRFHYLSVWLGVHLLSRSPIVHADGPLSIRGAFTIAEMKALAVESGMPTAVIRSAFPCRMLLSWSRA